MASGYLLYMSLFSLFQCVFGMFLPCEEPIQDLRPPPLLEVKTFQAEMEIVLETEKSNLFVWEYYDSPNDRIAFKLAIRGKTSFAILDYRKRQAITYYQTTGCLAKKLDTDYGIKTIVETAFPELGQEFNLSSGHLFTPSSIFGINQMAMFNGYTGKKIFRSYPGVDSWLYCMPTNEKYNTSILTFWSVPGWEMPSQAKQPLPLGYQTVSIDTNKKMTTTVVNIVNFHPYYVDPSAFEIPAGRECIGFPTEPPMPQIPYGKALRFRTEVTRSDSHTISYTHNWFSFEDRIFKVQVNNGFADKQGIRKTSFFDFDEGNVDPILITQSDQSETPCTIRTIKSDYQEALGETSFFKIQFLKNKDGIFGWSNTDSSYLGERTHSNIRCSVWQQIRNDWSPTEGNKIKSLWDWYFTNKSYVDIQEVDEYQVPIYLEIKILTSTDPKLTANTIIRHHIHDFHLSSRSEEINNELQISQCFPERQEYNMQFQINVNDFLKNYTIANLNSWNFIKPWRTMLYISTLFPMLRIVDVKTTEINHEVYVQFKLLDVFKNTPKDAGSYLMPVEKAIEEIQNFVNGGEFQANVVMDNNNVFAILALNGSFEKVEFHCSPFVQPTDEVLSTPPVDSTLRTSSSSFLSSTPPTTRTEIQSTAGTTFNKELKKSTLFSSGKTTGITIGSFIVGLVAGISSVLIFKWKKNRNSDS